MEIIPRHIGIVMDGNGRWAKQRKLPRLMGHQAGTENTRRVLRACGKFGIEIVTLYGFSTENWQRPKIEVAGLFSIFENAIDREVPELHRNGVRLRHLGRTDRLPKRLVKKIESAMELTKDNDRLTLNLAFNYGGRAEIVDATRRIIAEGIDLAAIDEGLFASYLYTAGLPDLDLFIRTGGEMRLSNFLLWQTAYAEYYTTPTYWPDFDEAELEKALLVYSQRKRKFGGLIGE
ncbi:MAG: polyprenyl diphosphate synthase [Anaerolineae bacterium]